MRTSAFIAATLAGVASAWPKFSGTASAIKGSGGVYPTGTGVPLGPGPVSINHHSSGGFFPSGSSAATYTGKHHSSGGFFPSGSGAATYTGKHYSTGVYSHSKGGATGSGHVAPTGTGHGGGSGGGHTTLVPTTITITGNVPTTTTKTVEFTNTITTTISKPH